MAMDDYMKLPYHLDLVGHPDEDGYVASYFVYYLGRNN